MKRLSYLILSIVLINACQQTADQPEDTNTSEPEVNTELVNEDGLQMVYLNIPDGFDLQVYGRVDNARQMAMSENGTLYVSNRRGGNVYRVKDTNGDFKIDELDTLLSGLDQPNGVAIKDGDLYVADISKLWVIRDVDNAVEINPELIYDDYPTETHHGWKFIAFGPDGKLYVPVGAPCNICEPEDEIYATITRMDPDGTNREIYARGVRNTVGFTWHPETGELWFTDNNRDWLGDDGPPCELNRVSEMGQHFGYPYCHGGNIVDPGVNDDDEEFEVTPTCEGFTAPAQNLGPHVAPLGVKFYTGDMFPEQFKNLIFIAEHGSWNRSPEAGHTGHLISMVREENGEGVEYETFIDGFLIKESNEAWGRPVDLLVLEDGSMLISDDKSGTIYRLTYKG